MIQDLVVLGRMVEAKVGLSHLWIQGNGCRLEWGSAVSCHKEKSCEGWWAKTKSPPVQEGSGLLLGNLFPVLQYIGSKSLRTAEIGQLALEHSHSPQFWVATLGMLVLTSIELGSVGFLGQDGLSWGFSKSRQMLWEESIKT